jgi:hypothetical protein
MCRRRIATLHHAAPLNSSVAFYVSSSMFVIVCFLPNWFGKLRICV